MTIQDFVDDRILNSLISIKRSYKFWKQDFGHTSSFWTGVGDFALNEHNSIRHQRYHKCTRVAPANLLFHSPWMTFMSVVGLWYTQWRKISGLHWALHGRYLKPWGLWDFSKCYGDWKTVVSTSHGTEIRNTRRIWDGGPDLLGSPQAHTSSYSSFVTRFTTTRRYNLFFPILWSHQKCVYAILNLKYSVITNLGYFFFSLCNEKKAK